MRTLGIVVCALCVNGWSHAQDRAWVEESNKNAQILLQVQAKLSPESAGRLGLQGLDTEIRDFSPGGRERARKLLSAARTELEGKLKTATHPAVRQDLEIMLDSTAETLEGMALSERHEIPYVNAWSVVFGGLRSLLDDQVAAERRGAALVRLRKYAGLEPGYAPAAKLLEQNTREKLNQPGLAGPPKAEVERDLRNAKTILDGIGGLFEKYRIEGYQEPLAVLKDQMAGYAEFVRNDVLPKARTDFRLPSELYAFRLKGYGVDIPAAELAAKARAGFLEIQKEMEAIAPKVAQARGWKMTGYREVIRELKKEQFQGEDIYPHYVARIKDLEKIVREHNLVTLPNRGARMRLASAAESAQQPAPSMRPPRMVGNTGERGEFVLPLRIPSPDGKTEQYDDFTFAAASWTLTAHEARPGHEMQFAAMVERGVSIPRSVYAGNSVNVEGWGLYSEWFTKPYFPPEGQLISLQHRLLRAARAFLDPELHMGKITPAEARRILSEDAIFSNAAVTQEIERYTFRSPAQATSYFYGYTRLLELRNDVEQRMGPKFQAKDYHDFVLAQGMLPPKLLRKAVMEEFVPARLGQ